MQLQSINKKSNFKNLSYFRLVFLLILGSLFCIFGNSIVANEDKIELSSFIAQDQILKVENEREKDFIEAFCSAAKNQLLFPKDIKVKDINKDSKKITFIPSDKGQERLKGECTLKYELELIQLGNCKKDELKVKDDNFPTLKKAFIEVNGYSPRLSEEDLGIKVSVHADGKKTVSFSAVVEPPSHTEHKKTQQCKGSSGDIPFSIVKPVLLSDFSKKVLEDLLDDKDATLITAFVNNNTDKKVDIKDLQIHQKEKSLVTFMPSVEGKNKFQGECTVKYSVKSNNPNTNNSSQGQLFYKKTWFIIIMALVIIAIIGLTVTYLYKTQER